MTPYTPKPTLSTALQQKKHIPSETLRHACRMLEPTLDVEYLPNVVGENEPRGISLEIRRGWRQEAGTEPDTVFRRPRFRCNKIHQENTLPQFRVAPPVATQNNGSMVRRSARSKRPVSDSGHSRPSHPTETGLQSARNLASAG